MNIAASRDYVTMLLANPTLDYEFLATCRTYSCRATFGATLSKADLPPRAPSLVLLPSVAITFDACRSRAPCPLRSSPYPPHMIRSDQITSLPATSG